MLDTISADFSEFRIVRVVGESVWEMMSSDLSSALRHVESALRRLNRRSVLRALRAGAAPDWVRSALGAVGLEATRDIESLWGWRNGTLTAGTTLGEIDLFPGFYLLSVEEAVANYRAFASDARWSVTWLPIFADGGGDFYVVDFHDEARCAVRHFRLEEVHHPIVYESLSAMVSTLDKAFDVAIFFVDSEGYLEVDDARFDRLARTLNPGVTYWSKP
jgi:hypothetical protein